MLQIIVIIPEISKFICMQDFINNIFPFEYKFKKICEYDYYFDNSLDMNSILSDLNSVDAWLF